MSHISAVSQRPLIVDLPPRKIVSLFGGRPESTPRWRDFDNKKRRLVFEPNTSMIALQEAFELELCEAVRGMGDEGKRLETLPSARGCVRGYNHVLNAREHENGKYFYITDLRNAFANVDLVRLAGLVTYIFWFEELGALFDLRLVVHGQNGWKALLGDGRFQRTYSFLSAFFSGLRGTGLAFGGPASPYLFNLYCEVYVDEPIRAYLQRMGGWHVDRGMTREECLPWRTTYTRYVDDLVFSRGRAVWSDMRKRIRSIIADAGFEVKHGKSRVLCRDQGVVTVTKVGLAPGDGAARLVFGRAKARQLEGALGRYEKRPEFTNPNKVAGLVGQFIYFTKMKNEHTQSEIALLHRCKDFERVAADDPRLGKKWRLERSR